MPPRYRIANAEQVQALADVLSQRRYTATVFKVTELPGPAWAGCYELVDESQLDELEAAIVADLKFVTFRLAA